jgi:hypothetical protein
MSNSGFVREGIMISFPLCFPGVTIPIPSDESLITALDVSDDGTVYGGTSGKKVHLFAARFHGATGVVFDMGVIEDTEQCAAICWCEEKFVACANGEGGGRLVMGQIQKRKHEPDYIQEWGARRPPLKDMGTVIPGEKIIHALASPSKKQVIGTTDKNLFVFDVLQKRVTQIYGIHNPGHIGISDRNNIVGIDADKSIWLFNPAENKLNRKSFSIPEGTWGNSAVRWARNPVTGCLYTADENGNIFSFTEEKGFSEPLAKTVVTPVGPMAVTLDGRLFGFCGGDISRLFCYNPRGKKMTDLGPAVSVIARRRYGYQFGDAVTGRDGEIYFGENDNLGHIWLYFPRICRYPMDN